jgi:hypothetical protein
VLSPQAIAATPAINIAARLAHIFRVAVASFLDDATPSMAKNPMP